MNTVAKPFALYTDHPLASAYASFLPEEYRGAPREEWWTWRTHEVHVDRTLPTSDPKDLLVVLIHGGGGNGRLLSPRPVLVVHPGDDRWTAPELSKRFFDRIRGAKEWVLLPDGGHFPIEPVAITALRATLLRHLAQRAD